MAKATAPMFSLEAAGKLGDCLILQTWRGRPYFRRLTKPPNKPSAKQFGLRQLFGGVSALWSTWSDAIIAQWADLADSTNVTKTNACLASAIDRGNANLGPQQYPGAPGPINIHTGHSLFVYKETRFNDVHIWDSVQYRDAWCAIVFRRPNGTDSPSVVVEPATMKLSELRTVLPPGTHHWHDTDVLDTQGYAYRVAFVYPDGTLIASWQSPWH